MENKKKTICEYPLLSGAMILPMDQINTPVLISDKTNDQDISYFVGLARRGSTIGFHLLWHTVELAMSTRLCLI